MVPGTKGIDCEVYGLEIWIGWDVCLLAIDLFPHRE